MRSPAPPISDTCRGFVCCQQFRLPSSVLPRHRRRTVSRTMATIEVEMDPRYYNQPTKQAMEIAQCTNNAPLINFVGAVDAQNKFQQFSDIQKEKYENSQSTCKKGSGLWCFLCCLSFAGTALFIMNGGPSSPSPSVTTSTYCTGGDRRLHSFVQALDYRDLGSTSSTSSTSHVAAPVSATSSTSSTGGSSQPNSQSCPYRSDKCEYVCVNQKCKCMDCANQKCCTWNDLTAGHGSSNDQRDGCKATAECEWIEYAATEPDAPARCVR